MRILTAEIEIDDRLQRGVVVDFDYVGVVSCAVPLAEMRTETPFTRYYAGRLVVEHGRLTAGSLNELLLLFEA